MLHRRKTLVGFGVKRTFSKLRLPGTIYEGLIGLGAATPNRQHDDKFLLLLEVEQDAPVTLATAQCSARAAEGFDVA